MKKLLFCFIFLLPALLFASESRKGVNYKDALSYYKAGNFQKSYDAFSKIYLHHLDDVTFNFYFGRSAYESGHYEMALAAFERVEMQDASNIRNRLEMARTYYMLKMYEDAENAFKEVLANPNIPQNIRTSIEVALSQVSKVQKKSFTYASVLMGMLYDSNVNYGSLGDYNYGGGTLEKINEKADIAFETYANVVNVYDIGAKNGFAVKNSLAAYLKEYATEKAYNTLYLAYTPSLLYKVTKYTVEVALSIDTLLLDYTRYFHTFSFVPTLHYNHTTTLSSFVTLEYQRKLFEQNSLDANRLEAAYGLQKILSPRSYLQGNIYLINESKVRGSDIYVDFTEYKTDMNYANQFSSDFGADFFAQLRYRGYSDYSDGFGSVRKDIGGLANANFSYHVTPTLQANLKMSYEYVNSNQDRFTYAKYTLFAGINKTF